MEQQFILRLPENLRNSDPKDFKMIKKGQKEVSFYIKDKEYSGIICKLPTIIETQKCIDNKLYKIADLSTLVVVYEDSNFVAEEEIKKHESCGLTPPMNFVKERKFSSVSTIRTEEIEEIERKVAELLLEDSKAMKVEILTNEKDSSDVDLDLFAAEIENDLSAHKKTEGAVNNRAVKSTIADESKKNNKADVAISLSEKIGKTTDLSQKHENISKTDEAAGLSKKHKNIGMEGEAVDSHQHKIDVDMLEGISATKNGAEDKTKAMQMNEETGYSADIKHTQAKMPVTGSGEEGVKSGMVDSKASVGVLKDSILLDIENKIKEKQDLFDKAVNPILKKRFEQALSELKSSYEQRKQEIEKDGV